MKRRRADAQKRLYATTVLVLIVTGAALFFFMIRPHFLADFLGGTAGKPAGDVVGQEEAFSGRKNIYDRHLKELAVSFPLTSIYARPLEVEKPEVAAAKLAKVLGLDRKDILSALRGERSFIWLGRQVAPHVAEKIAELNLKGVHLIDEMHRFYPHGKTAAHVVGFMKDEQGLAGIESYYDNVLRGGGVHDPAIAEAPWPVRVAAGGQGAHLILSLDLSVQTLLERHLRALVKQTGAEAGMVAVMSPENGEVFGLANLPGYDPNRFWGYGADARRNRIVADRIFPGGLLKLFRVAAAVAQGKEARLRVFGGGTGQGTDGGATRGGARPEIAAWTWVRQGIYVSPEIVRLEEPGVGTAALAGFADRLGLSEERTLDLPLETTGRALDGRRDQGGFRLDDYFSTTTGMGLLAGFSRLVSQGRSITPHLLGAVWNPAEERSVLVGYDNHPPAVSVSVSRTMESLLAGLGGPDSGQPGAVFFESLVEENLSAEDAGGGEDDGRPKKFNAVLLGLAPVKDPQLTMVVVLEGAAIETDRRSPLRAMAQRVLGKARRLVLAGPGLASGSFSTAGGEEYYRKWRALRKSTESRVMLPSSHQDGRMPDVRDMSLRKALQVLQESGLRVNIIGSGRVVAQHPGPGRSLRGGEECVLELRSGP